MVWLLAVLQKKKQERNENMIKVLNIISDTNIGGAGKVIINFSRNFAINYYF